VPNPTNPQRWNRYSYVANSPLNYIDPSGHLPIIDEDENGNPIVDTSWHPGGTSGRYGDDDGDRQKGPGELLGRNDEESEPTIPIDPTIQSNFPDTNSPPTNQFDQKPDWGKIAAGIGIIVAVDFLIVAPLAVGLFALAPELEVAMLLTEAWSWPIIAGIAAVNVYGWDLIVEGAKGQ
jgi:hypothetical protein